MFIQRKNNKRIQRSIAWKEHHFVQKLVIDYTNNKQAINLNKLPFDEGTLVMKCEVFKITFQKTINTSRKCF